MKIDEKKIDKIWKQMKTSADSLKHSCLSLLERVNSLKIDFDKGKLKTIEVN